MSYVHKVRNAVNVGTVYSDTGPAKGNGTVAVRVTRNGNIALGKSEFLTEHDVHFTPQVATEIVELLNSALDKAAQIRKLYADMESMENSRLAEIMEDDQ